MTLRRFALVVLLAVAVAPAGRSDASAAQSDTAQCGPGSRPETGMQGRVSAADYVSGYADVPITCNAQLVGHFGDSAGFKVERSNDLTTFTQVATLGANVTSYADTGLRKNRTYYYRVRAYNAGGNSGYSNTATGRTTR